MFSKTQLSSPLDSSFKTISFNPKYEIEIDPPHRVRYTKNHVYINEHTLNSGYIQLYIGGKNFTKNRLIAIEFIENPDPSTYTETDHIDGNKLNNTISNIRWVTHSENLKNRKKFKLQEYETLAELPKTTFCLNYYEDVYYPRYYYDYVTEKLIIRRSLTENSKRDQYKIIKPTKNCNNVLVNLVDEEGKGHSLGYKKLIGMMKLRTEYKKKIGELD